jgi:hypothetical protein
MIYNILILKMLKTWDIIGNISRAWDTMRTSRPLLPTFCVEIMEVAVHIICRDSMDLADDVRGLEAYNGDDFVTPRRYQALQTHNSKLEKTSNQQSR